MTGTPAGYTTVAPWIITRDTGALLTFVAAAFEGVELLRVPLEDGSVGHAEIRVGDTILLAFDQRKGWPELSAMLRVWVTDADQTFARAVAAGARVVTGLSDSAFSQRGGRLCDPWGNIWWVSATIEEVAVEEGLRRLSQPGYTLDIQEAQESLDRELSGRERSVSCPRPS